MGRIAKKTASQLDRLKANAKNSYDYFKPNYDRYHTSRRFVFDSSLSADDIALLNDLGKPQIECNVLEAYISRLRGEFAKQEPSITVRTMDGAKIDTATLHIVEDHTRAILAEANNNSFEYEVYTDLLSGGFSAMKVWTEYAGEMKFDQVIRLARVFDPTLCGWDIMARYSHKGDGRYSFENFPKLADEVESEYNIKLDNIKFTRTMDGFNWSYRNSKNEDIMIVCDYYEKRMKKAKIVQLSDGQILTEKDYEEYLMDFESSGTVALPPVVGRSRMTDITVIDRYRFVEDQIIDRTETDYRYLPHIFVDGNSVLLKQGGDGAVQQMTRPYIWHAMDTQKLKNYAAQTLANELENMVQSKWKVAIESIPEQYLDAYTNNQIPSVMVYKSVNDDNVDQPLPPPQEIQRIPMPPEVSNALGMSDQIIQNTLGAYDASLGVNGNDISGKAIEAGATNSNAASMPYVVGFLQGLNQAAQIIVDLIPKTMVNETSIPVIAPDGKDDFVKINQQGGFPINYSTNSLQVRVEAGVNFSVQKSRALQQIIQLTQASPLFGQFINEMGLEVLLDNLEIRGIDQLKVLSTQFMQQLKQQKQLQMQQMQNNPQVQRVQLEKQKLAQTAQQDQVENQLKSTELAATYEQIQNDRIKLFLQSQQSNLDNAVKIDQHQTEKYKAAIDAALQVTDQQHRHTKETVEKIHDGIELAHTIKTAKQQQSQQTSA
jgi:hypothetical protein